jgi:uncharacterized FlgJ-related protein
MTAISILRNELPSGETRFHAVAQGKQAFGNTLGEAIDGLTPQLENDLPRLIVIQSLRPDTFFTATQQQRLRELMAKWRVARDTGAVLPADENAELEALIDAELEASGKRTAALLREADR